MEYVSCSFIESGLVLSHKDLKFCCVPHSDCTKGYVPICEYDGGPIPVDRIREERRRLVELNNREGVVTPCTGCGHLRRAEWHPRGDGALFDWIAVDSFYLCNLRCRYCDIVIHEDWQLPDMAYDLLPVFREMLSSGYLAPRARVEWGGGEPSILQNFDTLQRLLLDHDVRQRIHTYAVRFSELIEQGLARDRTEVVTSVDAGTPETFEAIKGRDRFERVWANVARYAATGGDVTAKYVIRRGNSDSRNVVQFVRRCAAENVRKVALSPDLEEVAQDAVTEESAHAFALLDREAKRRGIEVSIVSEYLPDDRRRLLKYMPLGRLDWRYPMARARETLRRVARRARRRIRTLLHLGRTRGALRRANACLESAHPDPEAVRDLLEHQAEYPSARLRSRLVDLVMTRELPGRLSHALGAALGLSADQWTVDGEPAYLVLNNRSSDERLAPTLLLACEAPAAVLPLTVTISDAVHDDVVHTYHQPERRRIELSGIPAGDCAIFVIRTDKTWSPTEGEDRRDLGVRVDVELRPEARRHLAT